MDSKVKYWEIKQRNCICGDGTLAGEAQYKITVGRRPISGQLTKQTVQNVTWSVLPSEQVSVLGYEHEHMHASSTSA